MNNYPLIYIKNVALFDNPKSATYLYKT